VFCPYRYLPPPPPLTCRKINKKINKNSALAHLRGLFATNRFLMTFKELQQALWGGGGERVVYILLEADHSLIELLLYF